LIAEVFSMITNTLHTVWLPLTAVALVGSATAQAQTSLQVVTPPDSPTVVQGPGDITAGKLVQSPQGETIGTVAGLVPRAPPHGLPDYVLVNTQTGTTAIPYGAMDHLLRDAHLVVDRSVLAGAPRVGEEQIYNGADIRWKAEADSYWQAYR